MKIVLLRALFRRSFRASLSAILLVSTSMPAQDMGAPGPSVKMAPAPLATVVQGKPSTVPLIFRVANGYHINSNQPRSEFLIPTVLKVEATTDIVIGKITYPEGQDMSFAFDPTEKLSVYSGDFGIDVLVRPMHSAQTGKYVLRGTLKYQACDNASCYPPRQLPVSFEVKIAKAPSAAAKNPAQSPHAHQ
jgi:Disulphide bond corrector protein DsbC